MHSRAKGEIENALNDPHTKAIDSVLADEVLSWVNSLNFENRNRVIHDVSAASNEGYVLFDSAHVLRPTHKGTITRQYVGEIFHELHAKCIEGEELFTRADAAWRK